MNFLNIYILINIYKNINLNIYNMLKKDNNLTEINLIPEIEIFEYENDNKIINIFDPMFINILLN